jgi:DUF1365 family protein
MVATQPRAQVPHPVAPPAPRLASGIYECRVMHQRLFPTRHRLRLDELPELDRRIPGFSFDRPGIVSFRSRDYGPRDGSPLRPWIEEQLAHAGIALEGGAVRLLCFPRVLGYVFNPIAVWFCHGPSGDLRALVYEVSNTFGQRHHYLVPVEAGHARGVIRTSFAKELYVSPFIDMESDYEFRTRIPDERIAVLVRQRARGGQVLVATLTGRRRELGGGALTRVLARYPLVTIKVILGIHWEALKLRRKGAPFRRRGAPPAHPLTVVGPSRPGSREG